MREILFRGWNKKTKKMIDLLAITPLALNSDIPGIFLPFNDDIELMAFTGLTDKNGTKIFDGDFLKYTFNEKIEVLYGKTIKSQGYGIFIVEFDTFEFCLKLIKQENYFFGELPYIKKIVRKESLNDYEIIGNIHERPELLN